MTKSVRCYKIASLRSYWSSSDSLIRSCAGVKWQAGQGGNSARNFKRCLLQTHSIQQSPS